MYIQFNVITDEHILITFMNNISKKLTFIYLLQNNYIFKYLAITIHFILVSTSTKIIHSLIQYFYRFVVKKQIQFQFNHLSRQSKSLIFEKYVKTEKYSDVTFNTCMFVFLSSYSPYKL